MTGIAWLDIVLAILIFGVLCALAPVLLVAGLIGLIIALIAGSTQWAVTCGLLALVSAFLSYFTYSDHGVIYVIRRD